MLHTLSRLAASILLLLAFSVPLSAQEGFVELFNGRDLSGWDTWLGAPEVPRMPIKLWGDWPPQIGLNKDDAGIYSVVMEDGEPAIRISGQTWGALISADDHADYHLQLQYKWGEKRYAPRADKPRNSGLLYHSTGDYGAFWSYWMRSLEFEIMKGSTGDFTAVDAVAGEIRTQWDWDLSYPWQRYAPEGEPATVGGMVFRVIGASDRESPVGQWNTIDLYVFGDHAIHRVNGHTVLRIDNLRHEVEGQTVPLNRGKIQLQSEGAEVYFRHLKLRPIDALPSEASF